MERARAPQGHRAPGRPSLVVSPGDVVRVGERHDRWTAFVLVTCPGGEGWVPSRHLSATSGTALVVAGYDTTELALEPGEHVTVLRRDDESGWWWCRADDGAEGWVPAAALHPGE